MWESRPLPKIVRDPLAALSARGSFFVPAPPGIFLFRGRQAGPGDLKKEKLAGKETFLEKGSPFLPRTPSILSKNFRVITFFASAKTVIVFLAKSHKNCTVTTAL